MNVGDLDPVRRRASRAGWALPTSWSTARASRRRSRPTRPSSRSSGSPRPGFLAPQQSADLLRLFRVTANAPVSNRQTSPPECSTRQSSRTTKRARRWPPRRPRGSDRRRPCRAARRGSSRSAPTGRCSAGAYVARFRVRGDGLRLDVASDTGARCSRRRAVDPGPEWVDEVLPFVVDHARPLEFRVAWDGRREAAVTGSSSRRPIAPTSSARTRRRRCPPPGRATLIPRPQGLGGLCRPRRKPPRGSLLSDPRGCFPAGRYRLALRLRAAGASRGPLVRLSVTGAGGRTLTVRVVDGAEVPPGDYREVTLDFSLDRPRVLEFPVAFLGDVGVFFGSRDGAAPVDRLSSARRRSAGGSESKLHELQPEGRIRLAQPHPRPRADPTPRARIPAGRP